MQHPIHYCSYFDHRYLARALCLYDSLQEHSPEFVWHVLALSESCHDILSELNLPNIKTTSLAELELAQPELLEAKANRNIVEYYFTLTSGYCRYLIDHVGQDSLLTYLDSDLYFFDSPEPIIRELDGASVGIIEHRFSQPNREMVQYGRFNVGWVSFRNDPQGRDCLNDWYSKCLDWCYDRLEETRFADQKYLNNWPVDFPGVHIIQHRGANIGPWNVAEFPLKTTPPNPHPPVAEDGTPLVFAHFQYIRRLGFRIFTTGFDAYNIQLAQRKQIASQIYHPYLRHFQKRQESVEEYLRQEKQLKHIELRQTARMLDSYRPLDLVCFPYKCASNLWRLNWIRIGR
ncbi:hypothetical protein [Novipirellula sp.]|uniref:hypothetical protein n=1 Tax=Novipirellula sp. TaxID=2795430 RepID=UPI003561EEF8